MQSDVIVVGGGMVGAAIAYGFARRGASVCILDEGDTALRAARGNFGLTWVQSKGLGVQPYFLLTRQSVDDWGKFATELEEASGVDVAFRRDGGLIICLGKKEAEDRKKILRRFQQQTDNNTYDCKFIDRKELQDLFPSARIGPRVTGASFSTMDGHANPLFLLRAMLGSFSRLGGIVHSGQGVIEIQTHGTGFEIKTQSEIFNSEKIVIAAGLGSRHLAAMVGLDVPIHPERGQILVTERTDHMFPFPMSGLRQTEEGTVMIGSTHEDVGIDTGTTVAGVAEMTKRAIERFPALSRLCLVRAWGALRVLTPDGVPIYAESTTHPGAYVATCHSGVTLAAMHSRLIPQWVLEDRMPPELASFNLERFHVQSAA